MNADWLRNWTGDSSAGAFLWLGQTRHSTFSVWRVGVDSEPNERR